MTKETPERGQRTAGRAPDIEVRHEVRDVVRVLATGTELWENISNQLFWDSSEIESIFAKAKSPDHAIELFHTKTSRMPRVTFSAWELKKGSKSGGMMMLPGGGTEAEEILKAAAREFSSETGHTATDLRYRDDCSRTYSVTHVSEDRRHPIQVVRTKKEKFVTGRIPRGQHTDRRFHPNENIKMILRLSPEEVTTLLYKESYRSGKVSGMLLDSYSLNPKRHIEFHTAINYEETARLRNAIETEVWVYEAIVWKQLAIALAKTTLNYKNSDIQKLARHLLQTPDPDTATSAFMMLVRIKGAIDMLEKSYPATRKPVKPHMPNWTHKQLIKSGVPESIIRKRQILIDEVRVAYKAAFYPKK